MPLADYYQDDRIAAEFMARAMAIVSAVALLLSTAGVYALVSFTLSRRTREIGIRAALGAAPRRIVAAIFSRAFAQIGLGILAGSVPGYLLVAKGAPEMARGGGALVAAGASAAVGAFIVVVTGLACAIPARRALRINPTDALRAE
jgi:putative ABC transport system permease protein